MTRKFLPSLLCSAALCAAALPALSETSIRIVSGQEKQNGAVIRDILTAYDAADAEVAVTLDMDNKSDVETTQQVLADIISGSAPDAVRVTGSVLATYINSGRAQPLDACLDAQPELLAQLDTGLLDNFRGADGKLYAMPFYTTLPALYINKQAFRDAGLDPETPPATWSELRAAAATLSDADKGKYGVLFYMPNTYLFEAQMESAGGAWTDASGALSADNPGTVDTFAFLRGLVEDGSMPAIAPSAFWSEFAALFRSGDLGMMLFSASTYPGLIGGLEFETTIAPMPIKGSGSMVANASANGFVMLATDPAKQEATCKALSSFLTPEAVTQVVKTTATVPHNVTATAAPDLLGTYFAENPAFVTVNAQPSGSWFALPGRANTEFQTEFSDLQFRVLSGDLSPEEGAAQLQDVTADLLLEN
ncbi:extracellular solute-binding protein [Pseudooceanicola sp. 200-1SW]|uniref:extracellular solute-binding protein n=1 Tax=Pseudooceanicola sp. 200-1SW TaxID=3425949 RepID=UPI003D7FB8AE